MISNINININDIPIHHQSSDLSQSEESLDDSTIKLNTKSNKNKDDSSKIITRSEKEEIECSSISSISMKSFNFLEKK